MIHKPDSLKGLLKVVITDKVRIRLCYVSWPQPWEPTSKWRTIKTMPRDTDIVEIQKYIDWVVYESNYLRHCIYCNQTHIKGHMHSNSVCQTCASKEFGVVY